MWWRRRHDLSVPAGQPRVGVTTTVTSSPGHESDCEELTLLGAAPDCLTVGLPICRCEGPASGSQPRISSLPSSTSPQLRTRRRLSPHQHHKPTCSPTTRAIFRPRPPRTTSASTNTKSLPPLPSPHQRVGRQDSFRAATQHRASYVRLPIPRHNEAGPRTFDMSASRRTGYTRGMRRQEERKKGGGTFFLPAARNLILTSCGVGCQCLDM